VIHTGSGAIYTLCKYVGAPASVVYRGACKALYFALSFAIVSMVKKTTQKVGAKRKAPQMLRRPAKRPSPPQGVRMGDAATRYLHALVNPFSKDAEGVRVPEPYAISTVTRKVHVPLVLTTNATGGLDLSVQPHLFNSFVNTLGTMTGGAGTFSPPNIPAGVAVRSAVLESAVNSIAQTYRIVAIGVRIKTNVDFTKSGGRVYGAILPASQELPIGFNANVTVGQALQCWEIPNDGTSVSTNILGLPRSFQFTVSELMSEGGCEVHFPICSPRALDFLDAQNQRFEQHMSISDVVGYQVASSGLGYMQAAGHSQFVLRGEGLAANTDVLTAEVIYHVEAVPLVGSATLIESMPHTPAPSTPGEIHLAHRIAAAAPVVSYVSQKLRDMAGRAGAGKFMSGASKVAGAAERVLGIAVRGLSLI